MKNLFRYRNKILAISFSGLALLAYLSYYLLLEIFTNWTYFRGSFSSNPFAIFSFAIGLFAYGTILIGNINNDPRAYRGISLFVAYTTFGAFLNIFFNTLEGIVTGALLYVLTSVRTIISVATLVVGIFLYINAWRYMLGNNNFKKVKLFSFLFALILSAVSTLDIVLAIVFTSSSIGTFFLLILLSLSEALLGWGILFTLRRLERI